MNCLLTMAGRLILMRHVIWSILVYYLMLLNLMQDGFRVLETQCREFLRGMGSEGNPRIPLIAWDTTTCPRIMGGLGITKFQDQACTLKHRSMSKLFAGYDTYWVYLAKGIAQRGLKKGHWKREFNSWSIQDILLLSPEFKVQSRMLRGLFSTWNQLSSVLRLSPCHIPSSILIFKLFFLLSQSSVWGLLELQDLMIWLGTRNIKVVRHLLVDDQWGNIKDLNEEIWGYHHVGEEDMSALLHSIRGFSTTNDIALQTCEGWEWGDSKIEFGGLALSTK